VTIRAAVAAPHRARLAIMGRRDLRMGILGSKPDAAYRAITPPAAE
jgi:hypothetical protein